MKGEIEKSWDEREGRVERWRRVQGEQKGNERRERRRVGGGGGGGGCAWVEDLPVNCAVASRVIGARLSERAWNSTPRGSARVHTLSVQDPCPSVSARQPHTSICKATHMEKKKKRTHNHYTQMHEDKIKSVNKHGCTHETHRAFRKTINHLGFGSMGIRTDEQTVRVWHAVYTCTMIYCLHISASKNPSTGDASKANARKEKGKRFVRNRCGETLTYKCP